MNGSKDNSGGGRGVGGGLRGGKTKQATGRRSNRGIQFREPDLSKGVDAAASRRRSSKKLDPKDAKGKTLDNNSTVWRHGSYVMVRPPRGSLITMRRGGARSHSHAGNGDPMADLAGLLNTTTSLPDVSEDILDDDEDSDDGDGSDDGDNSGEGGGDSDGDGGDSDGDDGGDGGGDGGGDNGEDGRGSGDEGGGGVDVGDNDGRKLIKRQGRKFGCIFVHKKAKDILDQCLDGDWITFTKIPLMKKRSMFNRFRTKYRWDPRTDEDIYDGFINVLKDRFRDIMKNLRKKSKKKARIAGHVIPNKEEKFEITCNFPPDTVPLEKWQRMCNQWNTEQWKKRSKVGRANRKNDLCRHTGGSIGFDEHRLRLDKKEGEKANFKLVFINTHATKQCKKRIRDGEINEKDLDELKFVTERSKRSYVSYMQQLQKLYGNTDCDDLAVWESLHPECQGRQLFGVGSSDPLFLMTGTPSSIVCGSYGDARQSQELQRVQSELEKEREARQNIEARMEQYEQEREQERTEREREREKERTEREQEHAQQAEWQKKMEEMMKKFADK